MAKKMTVFSVTFPLEGACFEGEEDSQVQLTPYIVDCTASTQKAALQAIANCQNEKLPFYVENCAIRMVMGVQGCKKETLDLTRIKVELVVMVIATAKKIQVVMKDTHPLSLPGNVWLNDPDSFLQELGSVIYTGIISVINDELKRHLVLYQRQGQELREGLSHLENLLPQV